ncbi:MAG: hypothetical protein LRY71_08495 [Bacillaceae bacterium]|nr:hypothetical protein [Bacillaceae bacterium]
MKSSIEETSVKSFTAQIEQILVEELEKQEELQRTLIKRQAQLKKVQRDNKNLEKQINNIEQSKTWKFSLPFRVCQSLSSRLKMFLRYKHFEQVQAEYQQIKKQLTEVENELKLKDTHIKKCKISAQSNRL